jgi:hypothetical protein
MGTADSQNTPVAPIGGQFQIMMLFIPELITTISGTRIAAMRHMVVIYTLACGHHPSLENTKSSSGSQTLILSVRIRRLTVRITKFGILADLQKELLTKP